MRVLHFYKTYFPDSVGGIEQVIRQMCVSTSRLGVQPEVLTLTRQTSNLELEFEGHQVHRVTQNIEIASNAISVAAFRQLARLAEQADVVHYHFPWPFMDLAHFVARVRKPTLVTYHSDIVRQKKLLRLYQPLLHRFLSSVDAIVATSPNYLASSPTLQRHREKTRIITYGLDRNLYPQSDAERMSHWRARLDAQFAPRFGQAHGARFFLFIGVLRYYKGLHVLLDALAQAPHPVVIVGAGPIEQELKAQVRRLGLDHVMFTGAIDEEDKVALLRLCYGMVFPSHLRSEAFGISLLEAAMFGKPMISCEIGTGTSYINVDGETGLVVAPDDPQALARAMRVLWDQPENAAAMGRRAEARFRDLFTSERMAANYTELYHELASGRAPLRLAAANG
jgi:rhamnosyl/mannosyltransferase